MIAARRSRRRSRSGGTRNRGVVLTYVLVMSLLFAAAAAMLMRVILGAHVLAAKNEAGVRARAWADACLAQKTSQWAGSPCGGAGSDACDFSADGGPAVGISCSGPTVQMSMQW